MMVGATYHQIGNEPVIILRMRLLLFFQNWHKKNKCVIMVTHSKELAQKADVILTLRKGTIMATEDIVLDEKIREGLMEEAERFLPPDDLKNKIMNKIKQ